MPNTTATSHPFFRKSRLKQAICATLGVSFSTVAPIGFAEESSSSVETIVVTGSEYADKPLSDYLIKRSSSGTKTDTALVDLPQAVQIIPKSVLEDQKANSITDAVKNASGVQQTGTSANRAETFAVRGFSAPAYAINGVMLNPAGDRPEAFTDMVDVESVQVIKGPASALYGRSQPGGLINIVTLRPTQELSGNMALKGGSFGFQRAEGTISNSLNDDGSLRGRFSGAVQTEEGFRDHRSRSNRQYGSIALDWDVNLDTQVQFDFNQTHQDMPYDRGLVVSADNHIHLPRERYLGEDWSSIDARKTSTSLGIIHHATDQLTLRTYLRYDNAYVHDTGIDNRSLQSDGRTLSRRYSNQVEDSENFDAQIEAQWDFTTQGIDHVLLTGLEYGYARMNFTSYRANIASIDIFDPVYGAEKTETTLNSDFLDKIRMTSVFLQDQITLSEQWKLLAGLRYDYVKQNQYSDVDDPSPSMSDGELTKRAGVVYQPNPTTAFYVSYAESFSPQSGQTRDNQALDPEKGRQVETGVKFDAIPDALTVTTSLFEITKTNVSASDPVDDDYSVTTGEQRVRGIEMDFIGTILPGWQVIGNTAWLDAEITKDNDYEVGNKLAAIPEWSGSLWTTYQVQSGRLAGLKFGSGVQAVSAREGDLDNSYSVSGYYTWDAMISWKFNKNTTFSLNGRNLTDQDYIQTPVSRSENHPGSPRSILATVNIGF